MLCEDTVLRVGGDGGASSVDSPFGDSWVLSLGFIFVALITIPLGYWNLDDIIGVQIGAGLLLFCIMIAWMYEFFNRGLDYRVPMFGPNPSGQIGTCVFNYAFIVTVPSWVNEKKPGISINKSIWSALLPAFISFTLL